MCRRASDMCISESSVREHLDKGGGILTRENGYTHRKDRRRGECKWRKGRWIRGRGHGWRPRGR